MYNTHTPYGLRHRRLSLDGSHDHATRRHPARQLRSRAAAYRRCQSTGSSPNRCWRLTQDFAELRAFSADGTAAASQTPHCSRPARGFSAPPGLTRDSAANSADSPRKLPTAHAAGQRPALVSDVAASASSSARRLALALLHCASVRTRARRPPQPLVKLGQATCMGHGARSTPSCIPSFQAGRPPPKRFNQANRQRRRPDHCASPIAAHRAAPSPCKHPTTAAASAHADPGIFCPPHSPVRGAPARCPQLGKPAPPPDKSQTIIRR